MSKKRGLSLEEKREKVLEIFHDTADVFVLKDIEKLASKKGVILQTVKEVLQSLVDDDLVHSERIGISNYFWAFPAEASTKVTEDIRRANEELAAVEKRQADAAKRLAAAKAGKEDSDDRAALMAEVARLQELEAKQAAELADYAQNDPETVEAMRAAVKVAKDGANRWLDNVYALRSWMRQRMQGREAEIDRFFEELGLTENVDYLA